MRPDALPAFAQERYVVVERLLSESTATWLCEHVLSQAALRLPAKKDPQVPGSFSAYADPVMESVLEHLTPAIEGIVGLSLFPTYSFYRLYRHGDRLERHLDREACEISVSLNLGQDPPVPWPLWVEGASGRVAIALEPGDGVAYRGIDCPHWRDALAGRHVAQLFLHYVDRNGAYADWKYDRRPSLSVPAV